MPPFKSQQLSVAGCAWWEGAEPPLGAGWVLGWRHLEFGWCQASSSPQVMAQRFVCRVFPARVQVRGLLPLPAFWIVRDRSITLQQHLWQKARSQKHLLLLKKNSILLFCVTQGWHAILLPWGACSKPCPKSAAGECWGCRVVAPWGWHAVLLAALSPVA